MARVLLKVHIKLSINVSRYILIFFILCAQITCNTAPFLLERFPLFNRNLSKKI